MCTADTLSRAPTAKPELNSIAFQNELEAYMHLISSSLPASSARLQQYCDKQKEDPVCSLISSYCATEWPDAANVPSNLKPYSEVCSELTLCNDILLLGCRIVVPVSLQKQTLEKFIVAIKASRNADQESIHQCGGPECQTT